MRTLPETREPWRVAVLTTGRQDYGILRSTLLALRDDRRFALLVYAGGMHLVHRFGHTIDLIRGDGVSVARELDFVADPADDIADTARAVSVIGDALQTDAPDALLVLGDRSETLAAGLAAALARVPVVHLHGGEETEGALDNMFRHALTKLSQLHLVSHQTHADRVRQMGEDPARIVVVGAPGLDHLYRNDLSTVGDLEQRIERPIAWPLILVTLHPTTLADDPDSAFEARAVAGALDSVGGTIVVTAPNADRGGDAIRAFWSAWIAGRANAVMIASLGDADYWGLMREADVMIGNSSSGIIEAPAVALPVVNVGDRQRGRLRGAGVKDVPADAARIREATLAALETARRKAAAPSSLYPAGAAAPRIVGALAAWLPERTLRKPFRGVSA